MLKTKVVAFKVTPVYLLFDDNNECVGEGTTPQFMVYPGSGFNIDETIKDIETNVRYENTEVGIQPVRKLK